MDVKRYLGALARDGVEGEALREAGGTRDELRDWRNDPHFRQAEEDALADAADEAEMELRRRAVRGWEEPVMYQGAPVYRRHPVTGEVLYDDDLNPIVLTVVRKSDALLKALVEAKKPHEFGTRRVESTVSAGVTFKQKLDLGALTAEQRRALRQVLTPESVKLLEGPDADGS